MRKRIISVCLVFFLLVVFTGEIQSNAAAVTRVLVWLAKNFGLPLATSFLYDFLEGGGGKATSETGRWQPRVAQCFTPDKIKGEKINCEAGYFVNCHATHCQPTKN